MALISPHLWYVKEAVDAARFYCSVFPDSRIDRMTTLPAATPSGPPGSVAVVEFTLAGQPFLAISAGPLDAFNHAVSFVVHCDSQAEIDRYWDALLQGGGTPEQCGWLRDRYGLCWQVVPRRLGDLIADADRDKGRRTTEAMLGMVKLDIAALERAHAGA